MVNNRQTRETSDIREAIDIVFACKRSRFRDAVLIHLYNVRIRQKKEKITIKRTRILSKPEDKMPMALTDAIIIINIVETVIVLAESTTNCKILILLDLIPERFRINAKRNGTNMIFTGDRSRFNLLKTYFDSCTSTFSEKPL
jgi:hypothetical protein